MISKGREVQRFLTIQPTGSVQKLKAGFRSLPQGPELKGPAHRRLLGDPLEDFEAVGWVLRGELIAET